MSLIEEVRAVQNRIKGPRCTVASWLDSLTEQDRKAVQAVMADPSAQMASLHMVAERKGWNPPKPVTLSRHRRGECKCDG